MPRAPRIEFENAVYHVMARGNRREPIVFGDDDRELFVKTFGEACQMAGWQVFAWVLMDNHYHAVFRTPEANLVEGMKWMQNAYTRRLNGRHKLWGHLFGGRYRSILVQNEDHGGRIWRDYLRTLINYVHMNPGRAGLVDGLENSILDYKWSSLSQGYAFPPSKRPKWLAVAEGLEIQGEKDTARGRRQHIEYLDAWLADEKENYSVDGVSLSARMKRGWYWGSEGFKEAMLNRYEKTKKGRNRNYKSSRMLKDHGERKGEIILQDAQIHYGVDLAALGKQQKGDLKRVSVAWAIMRTTTLKQSWIAESLGMKTAANVSQQVRRFEKTPLNKLAKPVRLWRKSRFVD